MPKTFVPDISNVSMDDAPEATKSAARKFTRYLVVTRNQSYTGKAWGIQINDGVGILDESSLDRKLGWTIPEILIEMRQDPAYSIEEITDGDTTAAIARARARQETDDSQREALIALLADEGVAAKLKELLAVQR